MSENNETSETNEEVTEETPIDFGDKVQSMSDEEFMEQMESGALNEEALITESEESTEETSEESSVEEDDDETQGAEGDEEEVVEDDETNEEETEEKEEKEAETQEETVSLSEEDQKFLAIGKQAMSEFTANGRKMKMKSGDDIIALMQMGANYHKKMSGLKPSLRTLKLLENHGLLDPDKLNTLIDLHEKKPEAIAKLLKDSNIDPLDFDIEQGDNYVPEKRTVNDTEIDMKNVLDDLQDSPTYARTLNVVAKEWDENSRIQITSNPEMIKIIDSHMGSGIFDKVAEQVAYEKSLGKLSGMSDFEAYQRIGQVMHEQGLLKENATNQQNGDANEGSTTENSQNDKSEQQRKAKKKAASPSRRQPAKNKKEPDYDPLSMSDEEFEKLDVLKL